MVQGVGRGSSGRVRNADEGLALSYSAIREGVIAVLPLRVNSGRHAKPKVGRGYLLAMLWRWSVEHLFALPPLRANPRKQEGSHGVAAPISKLGVCASAAIKLGTYAAGGSK